MFNGVVVSKQREIQAMPHKKKDITPAESQRNPLGRRLLVLHSDPRDEAGRGRRGT